MDGNNFVQSMQSKSKELSIEPLHHCTCLCLYKLNNASKTHDMSHVACLLPGLHMTWSPGILPSPSSWLFGDNFSNMTRLWTVRDRDTIEQVDNIRGSIVRDVVGLLTNDRYIIIWHLAWTIPYLSPVILALLEPTHPGWGPSLGECLHQKVCVTRLERYVIFSQEKKLKSLIQP